MKLKKLETKRLLLREFQIEDLNSFFEIFKDEEVNRFLPWYPLKTKEEAEVMLRKDYIEADGYHYAICLKEDEQVIGYVNVSLDECHDFGYGLMKSYWHKGFMYEACLAVIEQLKKEGIPFITATHDINNPDSGAVMRKLNMAYHYTYEEQWQPKNIPVTFRMYQLNLDHDDTRVCRTYWNTYSIHYIEDEKDIKT